MQAYKTNIFSLCKQILWAGYSRDAHSTQEHVVPGTHPQMLIMRNISTRGNVLEFKAQCCRQRFERLPVCIICLSPILSLHNLVSTRPRTHL